MIRSQHANEDFTVLANKIKDGTVTLNDVAKVILTVGKIALNIRSNEISIMKKLGVELQKPKTTTETNATDNTTGKEE